MNTRTATSKVGQALTFDDALEEFRITGTAVDTSFGTLLGNRVSPDSYTHQIHPYPAKLFSAIPRFFVKTLLKDRISLVADPFCGSGTTLLEAILLGHDAVGFDINPLACLISTVKTTAICSRALVASAQSLVKGASYYEINGNFCCGLNNLDYWFSKRVIEQLSDLRGRIDGVSDIKHKRFLEVCFAKCVRDVSRCDPRLTVPVRLKPSKFAPEHWLKSKFEKLVNFVENVNVADTFLQIVQKNADRLEKLSIRSTLGSAIISQVDVRIPLDQKLCDRKADLIVTSPPYLGAQKYIRSSSLQLAWLGLADSNKMKNLKDSSIGRDQFRRADYTLLETTEIVEVDQLLAEVFLVNPLRAHIAATYVREMRLSLRNSLRLLKQGGYYVLVAGENQLCGNNFPTPRILQYIMERELNLQIKVVFHDPIRSRGLMSKRRGSERIIQNECIMVFRKV